MAALALVHPPHPPKDIPEAAWEAVIDQLDREIHYGAPCARHLQSLSDCHYVSCHWLGHGTAMGGLAHHTPDAAMCHRLFDVPKAPRQALFTDPSRGLVPEPFPAPPVWSGS